MHGRRLGSGFSEDAPASSYQSPHRRVRMLSWTLATLALLSRGQFQPSFVGSTALDAATRRSRTKCSAEAEDKEAKEFSPMKRVPEGLADAIREGHAASSPQTGVPEEDKEAKEFDTWPGRPLNYSEVSLSSLRIDVDLHATVQECSKDGLFARLLEHRSHPSNGSHPSNFVVFCSSDSAETDCEGGENISVRIKAVDMDTQRVKGYGVSDTTKALQNGSDMIIKGSRGRRASSRRRRRATSGGMSM
eukprot:CAMPEP_0178431666 /NCGR_PEP_ID=MMETSP0689_2-20121128/31975_1 /TAXON_ID=160604 /ORGANISM="Amphidinium massartii, Strain CS-259" /LENGTH=246 /DNA_ID=CAMNT_0020053605 /DNA_START=96 /DNA_END=834 /DNA_ORIENTATION=-